MGGGKMSKNTKNIYNVKNSDAQFIDSAIREFSFEPPEYFDEIFEVLKNQGLNPLNRIMQEIEHESRKILTDHGYSPELHDLSHLVENNTRIVELKGGGTAFKTNVPIRVMLLWNVSSGH